MENPIDNKKKDQEYCVRNFEFSLNEEEDTKEFDLNLYQILESDVNGVVWDASLVLASYLIEIGKRNPGYFKQLSVLELGAGIGCPGLTAACLGANVLLTDTEEGFPLLEYNLSKNAAQFKNRGEAKCEVLQWSKAAGENLAIKHSFKLIIIADCVYYEESINPLVDVLRELMLNDTKLLICQEMRKSVKQRDLFKKFNACIKEFLDINMVPLSEQDEHYRSSDILLLMCTRKE